MKVQVSRAGFAIDKAIAILAPRWARNRLLARTQFALASRALEAGKQDDRLAARRRAIPRGPQQDTRLNLETTRAQARDLYRLNGYARGTINTIVANLVGCGIMPKPMVTSPRLLTPDENFNDAASESWKRWSDHADVTGKLSFYELQAQTLREKLVAGECLMIFQEPKDDREIPLAIDVAASERLADKDEIRRDGTKIIQGVEFAASGQIVAYWLYPSNPHDTMIWRDEPQRIPAARVLHIFDQLEPGAVRGLTRFMAAAGTFEALAQFLDWNLAKARISSAFTLAILQSGTGIAFPSTGDTADDTDDAGNEEDYTEGGLIFHGKPGEDVKGVSSNIQSAETAETVALYLRQAARGMDVSYEVVSRDLTRVTYLSGRIGENQDRRAWEPQQEALNRQVNLPVYQAFLGLAALSGALPVKELGPRYRKVEFVRPGFPWLDPVKEVQADLLAVQAGFESPIDIITRRGKDPWRVLQEIEQFKAWAEDKGLDLACFKLPGAAAPGEAKEEDDTEDQPANAGAKQKRLARLNGNGRTHA